MNHSIARIAFMVPAIVLCAMIVPIQVVALAVLCVGLAEYVHQNHLHRIMYPTKGKDNK